MKQLYRCFLALSLILVSVTSINAAYCEDSRNCCPFNGLTNDTCGGKGTSDMADLLGYMLKGEDQILIFGAPYGIYYIWGINYFWLRGAFANLFLNTLFGYVLEIPKSNYTEHTYYLIQTTSCPSITVLTSDSVGTMPTTSLSFSTLYKAVGRFTTKDPSCPGPCNLVPASYQYKHPDFFNTLSIGQSGISLFFSSLVSLEYDSLDGKVCRCPLAVAVENGLRIRQGSCPSTYVLQDYPKSVDQTCKDPYQITAEGAELVARRFDFNVLNEPGGLCALSVAVGTINGDAIASYLLTYTRCVIMKKPYDEVCTLNILLQSDSGYLARKPFWELC